MDEAAFTFSLTNLYYALGWTFYPLIIFAVFLTVWSVRLFLETPLRNQIAAFSITSILPILIGLLGFATGWRGVIEIMAMSGGAGKVFLITEELAWRPIVGLAESIFFLGIAIIIFLRYTGLGSQQESAEPKSISK